eukprot:Clim_evm28s195 gene=Clim_evmTU28s195
MFKTKEDKVKTPVPDNRSDGNSTPKAKKSKGQKLFQKLKAGTRSSVSSGGTKSSSTYTTPRGDPGSQRSSTQTSIKGGTETAASSPGGNGLAASSTDAPITPVRSPDVQSTSSAKMSDGSSLNAYRSPSRISARSDLLKDADIESNPPREVKFGAITDARRQKADRAPRVLAYHRRGGSYDVLGGGYGAYSNDLRLSGASVSSSRRQSEPDALMGMVESGDTVVVSNDSVEMQSNNTGFSLAERRMQQTSLTGVRMPPPYYERQQREQMIKDARRASAGPRLMGDWDMGTSETFESPIVTPDRSEQPGAYQLQGHRRDSTLKATDVNTSNNTTISASDLDTTPRDTAGEHEKTPPSVELGSVVRHPGLKSVGRLPNNASAIPRNADMGFPSSESLQEFGGSGPHGTHSAIFSNIPPHMRAEMLESSGGDMNSGRAGRSGGGHGGHSLDSPLQIADDLRTLSGASMSGGQLGKILQTPSIPSFVHDPSRDMYEAESLGQHSYHHFADGDSLSGTPRSNTTTPRRQTHDLEFDCMSSMTSMSHGAGSVGSSDITVPLSARSRQSPGSHIHREVGGMTPTHDAGGSVTGLPLSAMSSASNTPSRVSEHQFPLGSSIDSAHSNIAVQVMIEAARATEPANGSGELGSDRMPKIEITPGSTNTLSQQSSQGMGSGSISMTSELEPLGPHKKGNHYSSKDTYSEAGSESTNTNAMSAATAGLVSEMPIKEGPALLYNNLSVLQNPSRNKNYLAFSKGTNACVVKLHSGDTYRIAYKDNDPIVSVAIVFTGFQHVFVLATTDGVHIYEGAGILSLLRYRLPGLPSNPRFARGICCVKILPMRKSFIVVGTSFGSLTVFNCRQETVVYETDLTAHSHAVCDLSSNSHLGIIVSCDDNGDIVVWDMTTMRPRFTIQGAGVPSTSVRLSNEIIFAAFGNGKIVLYGLHHGKVLAEIRAHRRWINAIDYDRRKRLLGSVSDDAFFRLWKIPNIGDDGRLDGPVELKKGFQMRNQQICGVAFVNDASQAALTMYDHPGLVVCDVAGALESSTSH